MLSKTSAPKIGYENLAHPPLAHTIALLKGMSIVAPCSSDVIYTNKIRNTHKTIPTNSPFPISTNYIIGDHIKALAHLIEEKGVRGGLTDGDRNREIVSAYTPNVKRKTGVKYSVVIPVGEEKETISSVIKEVKKAGVEEIIVVANGADEVTVKRAIEAGATVLHYKRRLGHNVPRAIGAMYSGGEVCLFIDGDIVISAENLRPYLEAADQGIDVALNNLECLLDEVHPIHSVSLCEIFS